MALYSSIRLISGGSTLMRAAAVKKHSRPGSVASRPFVSLSLSLLGEPNGCALTQPGRMRFFKAAALGSLYATYNIVA